MTGPRVTLYCVTDAAAANIAGAAEAGATVLVSYFSGIVDERDHIRLGGYPGAFRELLGIRTEEFHPLLEGGQVTLSDGTIGRVWSEHIHLAGAEALATFTGYPLSGVPALTRRSTGRGAAWYLATLPDRDGIESLLDRLLAEAGVAASAEAAAGVELTRRVAADGRRFLFAINHGREDAYWRPTARNCWAADVSAGSFPAGRWP